MNHIQPNTVIVATGAKVNIIPAIDGIKGPNVVTPEEVLNAEIVLGKRVVVLGGGLIGVDTAYTIAAENPDVQVTILEPEDVP